MKRWHSLLCLTSLACASTRAVATANGQAQVVTETSGDPSVIVATLAAVEATDRDSARHRRIDRALIDYSVGNGTLAGFYDGASLRRLSAFLPGESGHLTYHPY